jgi:hypothetical protein
MRERPAWHHTQSVSARAGHSERCHSYARFNTHATTTSAGRDADRDFRGFKLDDKASDAIARFKAFQADPDAAKADALANALKALKEVQSKIDCTFALQMKEVDPNHDPKIHVEASQGGDAKIRRIPPPACLK